MRHPREPFSPTSVRDTSNGAHSYAHDICEAVIASMLRRRVVAAFVGGLCSVVVMKEIAEIHFAPATSSSPAVGFTAHEREEGHSGKAWPNNANPVEVRDLLGNPNIRAQDSSPVPQDDLGIGGRLSWLEYKSKVLFQYIRFPSYLSSSR